MTGIDRLDELPSLIAAQLGQQNPVWLHAQAGSQRLLRAYLGTALVFPCVEQMNLVGVLVEENLMHVLDGNQPFRGGDASGEAFGDGGLARAGLADN